MEIKKPHCSKLDRIFACPGSILPADGPREAGGPDAILGRARHEALSYIPRGARPPVDEIAAKYGVDRDDIALAVRMGQLAWVDDRAYFPTAEVERRVESSVCIGTSDIVQAMFTLDGTDSSPHILTALRLWDWKTGWGSDYHPYQLKGYGLCLVEEFGWPANDVVSVWEVWTSHRQTRVTNLSREEIEAFRDGLAAIIRIAEVTPKKLEYRAGDHCTFCPHIAGCQTREAWMRGAVTSLIKIDPKAVITREMIGETYEKYEAAKRAVALFDRIVKAALEDGPIPLPSGRQVAYVESEREKIGAGAAMNALSERLTISDQEELLGDLPKKSLDAWAKGHAPKGKKAALMREIYAELREADAIRTVPHRQRAVVDGE